MRLSLISHDQSGVMLPPLMSTVCRIIPRVSVSGPSFRLFFLIVEALMILLRLNVQKPAASVEAEKFVFYRAVNAPTIPLN